MKKSVLLLFAAAMVAMTVFMSTSCSKDDSPEQQQTQDYGDPFGEGNPYSTKPKFVDDEYQGYNFDIKWTPATYIDTTKFVYELLYCDSKMLKNGVVETSKMKSFGRQQETVYHFSYDSNLFDENSAYFLRLITYYWYNNRECQVEIDGALFYIKNSLIFF